MVTQMKAPLDLHDVLEQPDDIAVFLEEFQLQIVLATFDSFTHVTIMLGRVPNRATSSRRALLCGLRRHLPRAAMLIRHTEFDNRVNVGGRSVTFV